MMLCGKCYGVHMLKIIMEICYVSLWFLLRAFVVKKSYEVMWFFSPFFGYAAQILPIEICYTCVNIQIGHVFVNLASIKSLEVFRITGEAMSVCGHSLSKSCMVVEIFMFTIEIEIYVLSFGLYLDQGFRDFCFIFFFIFLFRHQIDQTELKCFYIPSISFQFVCPKHSF